MPTESSSHLPPTSMSNSLFSSQSPDDIYCQAVENEARDCHADAADLYQEAAIRGHLSAMVALGRHLIGLDDRTAVGWFRAAAERGHPTAWTELGHMYARGYGVQRSNPYAVACWQRGANLGDNPAKSCLGLSYIQGFGVPRDPEKGIKIVREIADAGDVISMRNLAWVYRTGKGVPKNIQEADYWDRRAAELTPKKPVASFRPPSSDALSRPAALNPRSSSAQGAQTRSKPSYAEPLRAPAPTPEASSPAKRVHHAKTLQYKEERLATQSAAEPLPSRLYPRAEEGMRSSPNLPKAQQSRSSEVHVAHKSRTSAETQPTVVVVQKSDLNTGPHYDAQSDKRQDRSNLAGTKNLGTEIASGGKEVAEGHELLLKSKSPQKALASDEALKHSTDHVTSESYEHARESVGDAEDHTRGSVENTKDGDSAGKVLNISSEKPKKVTSELPQREKKVQEAIEAHKVKVVEDDRQAFNGGNSGPGGGSTFESKGNESPDKSKAADTGEGDTKEAVESNRSTPPEQPSSSGQDFFYSPENKMSSPEQNSPEFASEPKEEIFVDAQDYIAQGSSSEGFSKKKPSFWENSAIPGSFPSTSGGLQAVDEALNNLKKSSSKPITPVTPSGTNSTNLRIPETDSRPKTHEADSFDTSAEKGHSGRGPNVNISWMTAGSASSDKEAILSQSVGAEIVTSLDPLSTRGVLEMQTTPPSHARDIGNLQNLDNQAWKSGEAPACEKLDPESNLSVEPQATNNGTKLQAELPTADGLSDEKQPSALDIARRAVRHHSSSDLSVPGKASSDEKHTDNLTAAPVDTTKPGDTVRSEEPQHSAVAAAVANLEEAEAKNESIRPPGSFPRNPPQSKSISSFSPRRRSALMVEIRSVHKEFPHRPSDSQSLQSVYDFVDVVQRLRADDKLEGEFLLENRGWDRVIIAMFAQPQDVCIQERSLHALIRLLRFVPSKERESYVLRSCEVCFEGLNEENLQVPVGIASGGPASLQGVLRAMKSYPSTRLVQMAGCAAIADLAEASSECRSSAVELGAITPISNALQQRDGKVMSIVYEMACRAVSGICAGPDMTNLKQAMAEQRIVEEIIYGLERWTSTPTQDDDYLLFATKSGCAALRHLCTGCEESSLHALNSNVFHSLTRALTVYKEDTATCTVAVAAIIAVASASGESAEAQLGEKKVLPTVLATLEAHSDDSLLVRKSLMCLETLASYKRMQKRAVEQDSVPIVTRVASKHRRDARVQEQVCSTLERLCRGCTAGQDAVAFNSGIQTISAAMQAHSQDICVMERASLAIANSCTNHPVNQNSAFQLGITSPVVRSLAIHGRQSDKLVIATSDCIAALAQAKDPVMGKKMAREEAPELLISSIQSHSDSAEVVEHASYALATLCAADFSLHTRLSNQGVERVLLRALQAHMASSATVLAIVTAVRILVSKVYKVRLRFMTDQSAGTGLAQLLHSVLAHHMHLLRESNDLFVSICGTLNFLAFECVPHKNEIGRSGIIEQLQKMIETSSKDANVVVLMPSLAAVCTLVLNSELNQDRFMAVQGVELILRLMHKWHRNASILENCCIALRYSCNQHYGNCEEVKRLNGVLSLNSVMKSHSDNPRLVEMACLALGVLCQGDVDIQQSSDIAEAIKATAQAMRAFEDDPIVQVAACNFLFSATFDNEANQRRAVASGGRTAIVKALESHPGYLELAEVGAYALLHVEDTPDSKRPGVMASEENKRNGTSELKSSKSKRRPGGNRRQGKGGKSSSQAVVNRRKAREETQEEGDASGALTPPEGEDPQGNVEGTPAEAPPQATKISRSKSRRGAKGKENPQRSDRLPQSKSFLRIGRRAKESRRQPVHIPDEYLGENNTPKKHRMPDGYEEEESLPHQDQDQQRESAEPVVSMD